MIETQGKGTKTYSSASLNVELANRGAVVHGVERGDLIDAHGGHLKQTGHLVHDADAAEAVLALAEIEQGHDGGLLVLRRVALDDLLNDLFIFGRELEGDVGVVVGGVAMLDGDNGRLSARLRAFSTCVKHTQHTTMRVSLGLRAEMERHARETSAIEAEDLVDSRVAARTAVRMRKGVSLVAMAVLIRGRWCGGPNWRLAILRSRGWSFP